MRNMEKKQTNNDLGGTVREASLREGNLGGSRSVKAGSDVHWCWPHSKGT